MKKLTFVIIPEQSKQMTQYILPSIYLKLAAIFLIAVFSVLGFLVFDYLQLNKLRHQHFSLVAENQHLKGEARILMTHLEDVKRSLQRVQDYTNKLSELVNFKVSKLSKKTGIGPLSEKEYANLNNPPKRESPLSSNLIPLGINIDKLILRPAFEGLSAVAQKSNQQAIELQRLLATLSQKKSLLSSIPSLSPVKGWITSNFGYRIAPFTQEKTLHKGIDIAAPVGTPIVAPADGVVIFSGRKAGFGNFIMIAHFGSGIVTRYGHNDQNMAQAGQRVKRGDQIASVGMTGRTTGPHLHYEVWVNGRATNPQKFILDPAANYLLSH